MLIRASWYTGPSNALVQLQARYNRCDEVASEKCLSAATFVSQSADMPLLLLPYRYVVQKPFKHYSDSLPGERTQLRDGSGDQSARPQINNRG
jgi:hypothetical protein